MVVHEKGGNKVREQTFKFRSSTFIYAWNYPPIRFIFFFLFLCWRIRIPLSLYFFFTSREILDLSLSRQSWLIFLQKSLYDSYNLNIFKLINMFRTSVSDLMTGTKSESFLCYDIYFYIFLCELRIERNLFLKLILYFHMAHFISGEKLTSLHCSKNEVEEIFVSQVDIKKLFSSIVPLWSFIFFLRENIFLFGKKICIFLKISYISIFFIK